MLEYIEFILIHDRDVGGGVGGDAFMIGCIFLLVRECSTKNNEQKCRRVGNVSGLALHQWSYKYFFY